MNDLPKNSVRSSSFLFLLIMVHDTISRRWTFTYFGATAPNLALAGNAIRYAVYQQERCPTTGRLHWQGFLVFDKMWRFNRVRTLLGPDECHIEMAKGSSADNRAYCTKEETRCAEVSPVEIGSCPEDGTIGDRKRCEFDDFLLAVQAGTSDTDLVLQFPSLFGKYPGGCATIIATARPLPVAAHTTWLYDWQHQVLDVLRHEPDPRTVHWIVDPVGNAGKTFLCQLLLRTRKADFYTGGRTADCAFACTGAPLQLFDLSRERADYFSYDFIEQVKNGAVFSTKYLSGRKLFPVPHVLVFSNWEPDTSKLSSDRWAIHRLNRGSDLEKKPFFASSDTEAATEPRSP